MRARDLKPHTEYATCDGQLVVTTDDLDVNWVLWYENVTKDGRSERVARITRPEDVNAGDPWAACKPGMNRRTGIRVEAKGVLVTLYDVDGEGKRRGGGNPTVWSQKDIPGTWLEYLSLHAETIRLNERRRVVEREARDRQSALTRLLAAKGFVGTRSRTGSSYPTVRVGCSASPVYTDESANRIKDYEVYTTLDLRGEHAEKALARLGVKVAAPKKTTARKRTPAKR